MRPTQTRALILAWVGAVTGAVAGATSGGFVGAWATPDDAGLEGLGYVLFGLIVGLWAGASIGAGVALRLSGAPVASSGPFWFFVLAGPIMGAGATIAASLTDADDGVPWIGQAAIVVSSALLTIYLARRFASAKGRSGTSAPDRD